MEISKYYTPTIEEFHVGFEYETEDLYHDMKTIHWEKQIYDGEEMRTYLTKELSKGEIRVKYLDRQDIESLGWVNIQTKSISKDHYEGLFPKSTRGKMLFEHDWLNNKITIKTPNWIRDGSGRFDGYTYQVERLIINNKSELKVLMKQLGINE